MPINLKKCGNSYTCVNSNENCPITDIIISDRGNKNEDADKSFSIDSQNSNRTLNIYSNTENLPLLYKGGNFTEENQKQGITIESRGMYDVAHLWKAIWEGILTFIKLYYNVHKIAERFFYLTLFFLGVKALEPIVKHYLNDKSPEKKANQIETEEIDEEITLLTKHQFQNQLKNELKKNEEKVEAEKQSIAKIKVKNFIFAASKNCLENRT